MLDRFGIEKWRGPWRVLCTVLVGTGGCLGIPTRNAPTVITLGLPLFVSVTAVPDIGKAKTVGYSTFGYDDVASRSNRRLGLDTVEVAVDIDLEKNTRMVGRAHIRHAIDGLESELAQIELLHEIIDYAYRIVLSNVVIKCSGSNAHWIRSSL